VLFHKVILNLNILFHNQIRKAENKIFCFIVTAKVVVSCFDVTTKQKGIL
jgi:hypothetical protein